MAIASRKNKKGGGIVKREDSIDETSEPIGLDKFLNQPNINMTIPWIYEICKTMTGKTRNIETTRGDEEEPIDLDCFLNQPNINMTIPWIYQIYKSVKSGNIGGGGSSSTTQEVYIEDLTEGN